MRVKNFTRFFKRELMLYSFGDFKFGRPIAVMRIFYVILFLTIWAGLFFLIFGLHLNVYYFMFLVIPPVFLGWRAGRPVWAGRTLFDFIKVNAGYLRSANGWCDLQETEVKDNSKFFTEHVYWISRRRELQLLADLREKRIKQKRGIQE